MKKQFLSILTVALSLCVLSGCSKDDSEPNLTGAFKAETLELSLAGQNMTGKEIVVKNNIATLVNLIPGETALNIPVQFDGTKIEGINSNADRDVTISGSVKDGKLSAAVTLKVKAAIVGKWIMPVADDAVSPLFIDFTTDKALVEFGMGDGDNLFPPANVKMFVSMMFGGMIPNFLRDVTFMENGNLVASYNGDMENPLFQTSPEGSVFYNVVGNTLYISPNIAAMLPKSGDMDDLTALLLLAEQGIPMGMKTADGFTTFYLDKQILSKVTGLLPLVGGLLPPAYQQYGILLTQLGVIINESNTFELGLTLKK